MKLLLAALLLISSSALAAPRNSLKSQLKEHSLTAFLKQQLLNLRNSNSTLLTSIAVDDLNLSENVSDLSYTLNVSSIEFLNFATYSVSNVATELTDGLIHFELDIVDLVITGNYTLDGLVSSVIALKGNGPLNILTHSVTIIGKGDIAVDSNTGTGLIQNLRFVSIGGGVNATFEGIVGQEIIGDLIKDDLTQIGSDIFETSLQNLNNALQPILTDYLNSALQENPIESILSTRVLDIHYDSTVDNGWSVDNVDCFYSESKINFTCNGQSVVLDEERGGSGFWLSCNPVVGAMCTMYFSPAAGERVHQIKLEAFYSANPNSYAKMEVYYVNAPSTAVEYFDENGIAQLDPTKELNFLTLYPNSKPMTGETALYTIVDRVTAITSRV